jgi:hypothetical protein
MDRKKTHQETEDDDEGDDRYDEDVKKVDTDMVSVDDDHEHEDNDQDDADVDDEDSSSVSTSGGGSGRRSTANDRRRHSFAGILTGSPPRGYTIRAVSPVSPIRQPLLRTTMGLDVRSSSKRGAAYTSLRVPQTDDDASQEQLGQQQGPHENQERSAQQEHNSEFENQSTNNIQMVKGGSKNARGVGEYIAVVPSGSMSDTGADGANEPSTTDASDWMNTRLPGMSSSLGRYERFCIECYIPFYKIKPCPYLTQPSLVLFVFVMLAHVSENEESARRNASGVVLLQGYDLNMRPHHFSNPMIMMMTMILTTISKIWTQNLGAMTA